MQVEVTQEDREAAADLLYRGGTTTYLLCREGKMDTTPGVQAFARHRQAAIQKARADAPEDAAKVAASEGGDEIPLPGSERQMHGTYAQGAFAATQAIATAIRQLQELGRHV